ncbi:hypothetical protein [Nocardia sp. NPDC057455]|uniref:TRAFAC clade GTPase domain-containing protein n=1 Tax=Nocardia sp. NPDC057455 TaxID=3346138 RepID=UPI00366F2EAC
MHVFSKRRCPYCGHVVMLGELPIVATNRIRRRAGDADGQHSVAPAVNVPVYDVVRGWPVVVEAPLDGTDESLANRVLQKARPPALPLLSDVKPALVPRRLCNRCATPMPEDIDNYPIYTIAVVGTSGAGKTHYLASMLREAVYRQGLESCDFGEFIFDNDSGNRFDSDYFIPMFRQRTTLPSTPEGMDVARNPLVCKVAVGPNDPALVLFHDICGEDLADPRRRASTAGFVRRADAMIFLVDPLSLDRPDGRVWQVEGAVDTAYANQANLLNACLEELDHAHRQRTPVAITLSKSDLVAGALGHPPLFSTPADMSSVAAWFGDAERIDWEVRQVLRAFGGNDLVAAGRRLPPDLVSFHAVAAIGENPSADAIDVLKPLRCLDPLLMVLLRLPEISGRSA